MVNRKNNGLAAQDYGNNIDKRIPDTHAHNNCFSFVPFL